MLKTVEGIYQNGKIEITNLPENVSDRRTLEEIMSEISHNAQERGLTPEILDSILNEQVKSGV